MRTSAFFLLICFLASSPAYAADYAKEVRKAIQKVLRQDFGNYQFFGVPLSNFGAGTMYPKAAAGEEFDPATSGLFGDPVTWWTVPEAQAKEHRNLLLPSGASGVLALSDISKKKFSLSAVVPELFALLKINAGFNWDKNVTVTLTADRVVNHRLNWTVLANQKATTPPIIDKGVIAHLDAADYFITIADLVFENFKVRVAVERKMDANAEATFTKAVAELSKDSKAAFTYNSTGSGSLELTAKEPVVAAVFIGEPPPGGIRADTPLSQFTERKLPEAVLRRMEGASVQKKISTR